MQTYKYLGVILDDKLNWKPNCDAMYKKTQSRLFFLRKLRAFDVCPKMLQMFYHSVVASVMFFAVVCWGGSVTRHDEGRLDKLVKKASSTAGFDFDSLLVTLEKRIEKKANSILLCPVHPLRDIILEQRSPRSSRFVAMDCRTERLRRSFIPHALRLFVEQKRGFFIDDE